ncbi:hypothetical protein HYH02_001973 [Chlamydomonas schloesseri]|uniref:Thioredoxin domain-containing protein n=1 Tax=Chlamydomonas schloesseri TaxID=2026947 RepID=A0A835WTM5_9CHLO|nr:hypothetical protein HYH02_001973 [Chlamydomonas schloesseri]|eukprot:KAG2453762.1 hypothetical protein HYH02_001973 [Chlamydomonas schloesseri]
MLVQSRALPGRQVCAHSARTLRPLRLAPRSLADAPRQSVDPLANKPRAAGPTAGSVYPIYTPEEVEAILNANKEKLVIVMCKASHCKPCKAFMPKYQRMAEILTDSLLLELTGDQSPETKKLMVSWGIKSTPTFRMYRNGEVVASATGARENKVLPVLIEALKDGEKGKNIKAEDLEAPTEDDDDE